MSVMDDYFFLIIIRYSSVAVIAAGEKVHTPVDAGGENP